MDKFLRSRKNLIRISVGLIAILLLSVMSGCVVAQNIESQTTEQEPVFNDAGTVQLYYVNDMEVVPEDDRYQLKQPDSLFSSLEEVMGAMHLSGGIAFESYSIDTDNNILLDITIEEGVSEEDILLNKLAIIKSIKELNGAGDIALSISGKISEMATYTDSSFFYYDDAEDSSENTGDVVLYLPDRGTLKKVVASVTIGPDDSAELAVINQLVAYNVLPDGTKINAVSVMNGTVTLDLSSEFINQKPDEDAVLVIYSVVNSLTSLPNVNKVQFLVDGEKVEVYQGVVGIGGPLEFEDH